MDTTHKVVICGAGSGAHVLAGLSSQRKNIETNILIIYKDKAEEWNKTSEYNPLKITVHDHKGDKKDVVCNKINVCKDPGLVIPGCDVIILTVPAYAHGVYLEAIKDYLPEGVTIIGLPGQPGFEFAVKQTLGKNAARKYTIASFESLPWACRVQEFGRHVNILGTKDNMTGAVSNCNSKGVDILQVMIGKYPKLKIKGDLLAMSLMSINSTLHPCIMFAKWNKWDECPLEEPPLFYQGIDKNAIRLLTDVSNEILGAAKTIQRMVKGVDVSSQVVHMYSWYLTSYPTCIEDPDTFLRAVATNRAYKGLIHPVVKTDDGGYVPDFDSRYLTEDIPYGLAPIKGICEIAGISTPNIDRVLAWKPPKRQYGRRLYYDYF
ncbi:unnamed protein product [Owenia fusiformis]|uniref:Opine dehydrogenase domain-containing protein n=1 Tax=Owenia fusiformis TaxID=6347 RepID=A0A8J1XK56_OWEFU|nr:unnamed protein product [Owenia fusiformis]